MKQIVVLLLPVLIITNMAAAQTADAEKLGWKAYSFNTTELGTVNYYITANKIDQQKPVLLYLDGSGAMPLFQNSKRGVGSTIPLDYRALSEKYHVVVISKPGVPFIDSVMVNGHAPVPAEYKKRLSLNWRVNSADEVLKRVVKNLKVDKKKITVLGFSEGFQVGAKLITENKNITHAVLVVGNGLNQLYDFIIQNRIDAQAGKISFADAQKNIDSLSVIFKDIYANSTATNKEWYGHTYLRWASFSKNIPMENLMAATIPVYVISAANDKNTNVLSTDYLALESLRNNKKNIDYKVYPYDHSLNEYIKDERGKVVATKNHVRDVIADALIWLD